MLIFYQLRMEVSSFLNSHSSSFITFNQLTYFRNQKFYHIDLIFFIKNFTLHPLTNLNQNNPFNCSAKEMPKFLNSVYFPYFNI